MGCPIFALFCAFIALAWSQCYFPNGSAPQEEGWNPCSNDNSNQNQLHTVCCYQSDQCLPNGVCPGSVYARSLCTERTWSGGACLGVCLQQSNSFAQLTPCDGTNSSLKWCCGETTECCSENSLDLVTISTAFSDNVTSTKLASTSATPSSALDTSTASSAVATPLTSYTTNLTTPTLTTISESSNKSYPTGAKAGIGIGAAVGALLFIGLGFFIAKSIHWKQRAKKAEAVNTVRDHVYEGPSLADRGAGVTSRGVREHRNLGRHEMP